MLFPFALLYQGIVFLRNKLFDANWISSKSYPLPVICVGNLRVGGTGKSPMVEYLIRLFGPKTSVAVLSRGYKRNTTGFFLLQGNETAVQVGDEPLQFKTKFPWAKVAVDENRQRGIETLMKTNDPPSVILLDDAFQHRKVKAGLSVLLTSYGDLYADDFPLPTGNLREGKSGAKRADIIVVTKCPANLGAEEQKKIQGKLNPKKYQSLYFASIEYSGEVTNGVDTKRLEDLQDFTLVTGIADPKPLVKYLGQTNRFEHLKFPDHHNFTTAELAHLRKQKLIVTTEKDYIRLQDKLSEEQLYYLPIRMQLLGNTGIFEQGIKKFVDDRNF